MIKLRTMMPLVTALTISTAAMQSCDTIGLTQNNKNELVSSPNKDTFEKKAEGKLDLPFTAETIFGTLGFIAFICGLYYLKNPEEAKRHLFGKKQDENVNNDEGNKS